MLECSGHARPRSICRTQEPVNINTVYLRTEGKGKVLKDEAWLLLLPVSVPLEREPPAAAPPGDTASSTNRPPTAPMPHARRHDREQLQAKQGDLPKTLHACGCGTTVTADTPATPWPLVCFAHVCPFVVPPGMRIHHTVGPRPGGDVAQYRQAGESNPADTRVRAVAGIDACGACCGGPRHKAPTHRHTQTHTDTHTVHIRTCMHTCADHSPTKWAGESGPSCRI